MCSTSQRCDWHKCVAHENDTCVVSTNDYHRLEKRLAQMCNADQWKLWGSHKCEAQNWHS